MDETGHEHGNFVFTLSVPFAFESPNLGVTCWALQATMLTIWNISAQDSNAAQDSWCWCVPLASYLCVLSSWSSCRPPALSDGQGQARSKDVMFQ